MDYIFAKCGISKSFVLLHDHKEIVRARYQAHLDMQTTPVLKELSPKPCKCVNSTEFMKFMKTAYNNLSILSSKGASAALLSTTRHILACNFISNSSFTIGVCILGIANHTYMMRFKITKGFARLITIYELSSSVGKELLDGSCPTSERWSLCNVCLMHTTKHCAKCPTMYCSQLCQRLDFKQHKHICGRCDRSENKSEIVEVA